LLVEAMKRRSHNALVEALWAWLRRNLVSMSCQTHRKDFAHARAEWTIRRAKAIDKRAPFTMQKLARRRRRRTSAKAKVRAKAGVKTQKRRGGAWRAYIAVTTKFSVGKCDFAELARAYRVLTPAQKRKYQKLGVAATMIGRRQPDAESAFGAKTRTIRRRLLKRKLSQDMPASVAVAAYLPIVATQEALDPRNAAKPFAEQVASARGNARRRNAAKRVAAGSSKEALGEFRRTVGATQIKELAELFPELSDVSKHLEAIPSFTFPVFKYAPPLVDCGSKLASWASDADDASLKDTLLATWDRDSSQVLDATVPAVKDDPLEEKLRKMTEQCLQRGFCVCCPQGRKVLRMENLYKGAIRPCFSRQAQHHRLIADGHIVIMLDPEYVGTVDVDEDEGALAEQQWFHVGMHYFKPVRSTFLALRLDCAADRTDAAVAASAAAISLKVVIGECAIEAVFHSINNKY
jgi:hypothetical protein